MKTVYSLIQHQAAQNPDAVAITAPNRAPLSYAALLRQVEQTIGRFKSMGIDPNHPVAIVLPNGPEMAVTFLAVAAGATAAPLNPAYGTEEFDFYLTDLNATALIVQADQDSPAREVAQTRNIPVIELTPAPRRAAGMFELSGLQEVKPQQPRAARPDDVALVLHTSGTTARPKIVPLTQANLCASAHNILRALELTPADRCLNVMPLFHIHGLMGALLSSMAAGASVVCTPGFDPAKFFEWVDALQPTWYSAVPTIHQAVLEAADHHQNIIARSRLRFIRSSSASLPPRVMDRLEELFRVPVIESYGMTEAAHQMASNPLPPRQRKAGSVGLAAGPEIAIMDEAGNLLPAGQTGEIVIRGVNVTPGYQHNPQANQKAFTNGWFRTGDQGYLDAEGYLYINGRLKEIINRGGEKIAPREVDEALLAHESVKQAITFAVPHPTLGEDVAAAIILHAGKVATEKELRQFAFKRLADYKVPSQLVIVDEIPKGPTGKLQRIGLAEKLAHQLNVAFVPPATPTEEILGRFWAEILGLEQAGIHHNFFAVGGDSLQAGRLVARINAAFEIQFPLKAVFTAPTIAEQALLIEDLLLRDIEDLTDAELRQFIDL